MVSFPQVSCQNTVCTCIPNAPPISFSCFDHPNSTAYAFMKDRSKVESLCRFKFLWSGGVKTSHNLPCWRIIACWLFMTTYSTYLRLSAISAGCLLQLQCDNTSCLGDSDTLASHHTHVAFIRYTEYKHHYPREKFLEKLIFIASLLVINSWMGSNQESSTFPQCFLFHFLLKPDHAICAARVQQHSSLLGRCTILPTTRS
jgi:hypothetical protein